MCGGPTSRRAGIATNGEDGRYELEFVPGIGRTPENQPLVQSTLISGRRAGYFEENLNRQGRCAAASALPGQAQLKYW